MEKTPSGVLQLLQSVDAALKSIRQEIEKLNERVYNLESKFQSEPYGYHGSDDIASLRRLISNVENDIYGMKEDIRDLERGLNNG